jgi:hypothetical protein
MNNTITVEHMNAVDTLAWHLRRLPREQRIAVITDAVTQGVMEGLAAQGLSGLGANDSVIASAVQDVLGPMLPALGAELTKAVEPALQRASDMLGPVLEEKIRDWGPILAITIGVVAGIITLIGSAVMGGVLARKLSR